MCSDVRGVGLFCQVDTGPWTLNIPWLVLGVLVFIFVAFLYFAFLLDPCEIPCGGC